jgi:subtilisin family serine protease
MALLHGTFMAGCLVAERGGAAPGISPLCSLLVRPVFGDAARASTTPECSAYEVAHAIVDLIAAGAAVINLSIGLAEDTGRPGKALEEALDFAVERNVPVVVAAGNHGCLGGCGITRHPWAIPVVDLCHRDHRCTFPVRIRRKGICASACQHRYGESEQSGGDA